MITNPFDQPPFAPEQADAWGRGFLFGLTGPFESTEDIPLDLDETLAAAFEQGRLAGQQSAIDGLDVLEPCTNLLLEHHVPLEAEVAKEGAALVVEIMEAGWALTAGAAFSFGFGLFLVVALATHTEVPPEQAVDHLSRNFTATIQSMGRENCAFFIGAGVDLESEGCQLQLSRVFRTQEQAHQAAVDMGRPVFFVGEWQANQCGTLVVVDGTTQ
jgi:hypothetical protein